MSSPACPHFDGCNAPLCPIDPESLSHGAWFPDEETCRRRDLQQPWVARQRKVARSTGGDPARGCFSVPMLARDCRITSAFRGLDPNQGPATPERVKTWLSEHPAIEALSGEALMKAREKMRHAREKTRATALASTVSEGQTVSAERGTETSDMKVYGNLSEPLATGRQRTTEPGGTA